MILFLDTISPLPEFSLIEDNKIIFSKKIINNHHEKMSDYLIKSYTDLEKKFSLDQKLENLIINVGPGSYTSLRIGIAFFSGLSLSYQIELKGIPCVDLYKYLISKDDLLLTGIYINSANNQKFICIYDEKKEYYNIHKIESFNEIENFKLKKIISNTELNKNNLNLFKNIQYQSTSFKEIIIKNLDAIMKLENSKIIEPIYISNNKILN
ncbi:hypothetical protein OAJ30_01555 [Alphaproteobacteria bacterium]|nr:hypothetical protein [Alphaproteobacteria bacterium]